MVPAPPGVSARALRAIKPLQEVPSEGLGLQDGLTLLCSNVSLLVLFYLLLALRLLVHLNRGPI